MVCQLYFNKKELIKKYTLLKLIYSIYHHFDMQSIFKNCSWDILHFYFVWSLQALVTLSHFQCMSIEISHISSVQYPHVASGSHTTQHNSRKWSGPPWSRKLTCLMFQTEVSGLNECAEWGWNQGDFHEIFRRSSQCLVELQPALGTCEQGLIRWNFSKLKISWANQESDWGAKQPKRDIDFLIPLSYGNFQGRSCYKGGQRNSLDITR